MVGPPMAMVDTRAVDLVLAGTQQACQLRDDGAAWTLAWVHDTDDETRIVVYRMAFGNARLCVGPCSWFVYDAGYCYSGVDRAIVAAVGWIMDGCQGEPEGWKKNLQTGQFKETESA